MKKTKIFIPFIFTFFVLLFYFFKRVVLIKYYPPVMDFFIFLIFFVSAFQKETVIQKFAKMINANLCDLELKYTRNLTYIWCVFLFINFLIALLTVFLSDKIWFIYNGCVSYCLIGLMFIIEYPIRILFRRKHNIC